MSLFQGFFLLLAGKLIFNMSWGPDPLWLVLVVAFDDVAGGDGAVALLVASLARTETQVAVFGTMLVMVLAVAERFAHGRPQLP